MTAPNTKDVLTNEEARKRFRSQLNDVAGQFQLIDDRREVIKESINELSEEYGIDKRHLRRLAMTIHKANYSEQQQQNRAFETFYELVIEGQMRDEE